MSSKEAWLPGQPSMIIPRPQLTSDAVAGGGYSGPQAAEPAPSRSAVAGLAACRSPYQPAVGAPVSYRYQSSDAGLPPTTTYRI